MPGPLIDRSKDLPHWHSPPLDEVALSVQFAEIPRFGPVHLGLLFAEFEAVGFSDFEEKPPLGAAFEVFGRQLSPPRLEMQAVESFIPRTWYLGADKHKLVQVQQDRFVYNWRRIDGVGVYPRLELVLGEFFQALAVFSQFLAKRKLPELSLNQCEMTYVNWIPFEKLEVATDAFQRTFKNCYVPQQIVGVPGHTIEPEQAAFVSAQICKEAAGKPVARLHTNTSAALKGGVAGIRLALTFRGPPQGSSEAALLGFFALGREAIVRQFDTLISERMHEAWGRYLD